MDKTPEQTPAKQDPGDPASSTPPRDPAAAGPPPTPQPPPPGATAYGYIAPTAQSPQRPSRSTGNCSRCGSSIEQGDAFCSSCGARTAEAPMPPQPEDSFSAPAAPSAFSQPYAHEHDRDPAAPPQPKLELPVRMSATGWILCGGAAAVAVAALLPWSEASASALGVTVSSVSSSPSGGGPVLLIVLAAAALGFGWPSLRGELSKWRCLGLAVVAGVLSIFVVSNWSDLGQLQRNNPGVDVTAGAGLYLYTAGVVAIWVSVVREGLRWRRARSVAKPVTTR
jgi:hypothetical protein